MKTQGSWLCWPVRMASSAGFIGEPNIGNGVITPMTGLLVEMTRAMARARSYSSRLSRSGRQKRQGDLGRLLADRDAQIHVVAGLGHLRLDPVQTRQVFGVGIGFWIKLLDFDLALGGLLELAQQIFDLRAIGFEAGRNAALVLGKVKADFHRSIELSSRSPSCPCPAYRAFSSVISAAF